MSRGACKELHERGVEILTAPLIRSVTYCSVKSYKTFHIYFGVIIYCSSLLQPHVDLSYEVPSLVSNEASEGRSGVVDMRGRGQ